LKGFVEGKRKLSENELKLLKQKLEVIWLCYRSSRLNNGYPFNTQ
jgi:hypothetical protein